MDEISPASPPPMTQILFSASFKSLWFDEVTAYQKTGFAVRLSRGLEVTLFP
jgi:hypothetical protein